MIPAALAAWSFLKGLPWKWIGIALAILFVAREIERHGYHERDAEVAKLQKTITDLEAASAQALAINQAQVASQEAAQADHTKDANHDDQIRRIAADDAVAAYIRLHHLSFGASGTDALPARPDAPDGGDEASQDAGVHAGDAWVAIPEADLLICKDNTLIAKSWQAWWPGAAKVINDAADQADKTEAAER